jgi:hypothetical protein
VVLLDTSRCNGPAANDRAAERVAEMKIKYILAGVLVALFAIPGTASQLAVRQAAEAAFLGQPGMASTGGAFSDPHVTPQLTIQLPTRFVALNFDAHPLASFRG